LERGVERGRWEAVGEDEGEESRRWKGTREKAEERSGGATECAPYGIGTLSILGTGPCNLGVYQGTRDHVCFPKFLSCRFNLKPPPDPGRSGLMAQRCLHIAAHRGRTACRSKGLAAAMAVVVMLVGRCEGLGKLQLANALGDNTVLQVMPARKPAWCGVRAMNLRTTKPQQPKPFQSVSALRRRRVSAQQVTEGRMLSPCGSACT